MKSLAHYIQEKLVIKKSTTTKKNKMANYKYFPQSKEELREIIMKRIVAEGNEVDLNDINVSNIKDMSSLFDGTGFKNGFNGKISQWDVSNVTNMSYMFYRCESFNQDISGWDVSKVTNKIGRAHV